MMQTIIVIKEITGGNELSNNNASFPLYAFILQTFTRLSEQVLAANKKDLDLLRMSINDEINLAALEEEEGLCDGAAGDQGKGCWC